MAIVILFLIIAVSSKIHQSGAVRSVQTTELILRSITVYSRTIHLPTAELMKVGAMLLNSLTVNSGTTAPLITAVPLPFMMVIIIFIIVCLKIIQPQTVAVPLRQLRIPTVTG